jgi:hypothetical protein
MVSGLPFYVWEVPGKPISIQLPFDIIDRMSPDILRGFGALKRRGAEVGGILLGRSEEGPRLKIIIEDFEPVPSEYLTGPSYNLSENDLAAFEAALTRRSGSEPTIAPVGFYRSHTRDELFMDDTDLRLASHYFPGPENIFLLVKPFAASPSVGGFFFWEDGEIYRQSTYLQFPFHRRELGGGETHRPAAPSRVESDSAPLPPYTPAVEQELVPFADPVRHVARRQSLSILDTPEAQPPARRSWRWLLVPLFLAITGVAGFFAYRDLGSSKTVANVSNQLVPEANPVGLESALPLKLSVVEKQNQIEVTWDRNAPAIVLAGRGVLAISDGSNRRDLKLTGPQLRNGRVLYSRLSGDVNLRMEVFPEGQHSVSESIRIVSTEAPNPVAPPPPVAPATADRTPRKRAVPVAAKIFPRPASQPPSSLASTPPAAETPTPKPPTPEPPAAPAEVELQRPSVRR